MWIVPGSVESIGGRTDHKEDDKVGGVGWQSGFWESRIQEWEQSSWQVGHSPSGQLPFCF